jgi:hypothetical protein
VFQISSFYGPDAAILLRNSCRLSLTPSFKRASTDVNKGSFLSMHSLCLMIGQAVERVKKRLKTIGKVRPRRVQRAGGELRRCTSSLLSRMCHGVCRWSRSACRATSRPFVTVVVGFQRLFFSFSSVCRAILSSHSSRHALKNILKTNDNRDKCPSARSTGRFRPPTNAVTTNDTLSRHGSPCYSFSTSYVT